MSVSSISKVCVYIESMKKKFLTRLRQLKKKLLQHQLNECKSQEKLSKRMSVSSISKKHFETRYVCKTGPGRSVTLPSLMSLADRIHHRNETGVELIHRWLNHDLGGNPTLRKSMERERQEFKYDLVKMNTLKEKGTIPEMRTSTWKNAVKRGEKIKEKLAQFQKLTKAENCDAMETYLYEVWCIHHPKRDFYNAQEDDFWKAQFTI